MANEDKGKVNTYDQSDLMGLKPFGNIGPDREDTKNDASSKVVSKLKKKKADALRAEGSTHESGVQANAGSMSESIERFANK